jgi:hypothetical protein
MTSMLMPACVQAVGTFAGAISRDDARGRGLSQCRDTATIVA